MSPDSLQLLITRDSDRDIKIRDLYVIVDDQPERNLLFGQSVEIEVAPGDHRIRVTNRLFSDGIRFKAAAGETIRFQAANVQKPGLLNAISFVAGGVMYRPVLTRVGS